MNSDVKVLTDLMKKHHEMKTDFLKHIVAVSSAVLAVYVSLLNLHTHNILLHQFLILSLLGSIVFATLGLYILIIQIRTLRKDFSDKAKHTALHGKQSENQFVATKYEMIYKIFEYVSITSFLIAVVCLGVLAF